MTVSGMSWPASPAQHAPPPVRRTDVAPITTPTGLRVAGFGRRVVPFLVDRLLCVLLLVALAWAWEAIGLSGVAGSGRLPPAAEAGLLLLTVLVVWLGPWLLVEVAVPAVTGTTPGKALLGLQVVTYRDGARPSVWRLLGRFAAAGGLAWVPFGAVVDHLHPLWQQRWATLHDLAAGTAVVHTPRTPTCS